METVVREFPMPRALFASNKRYLSSTEHNTIIAVHLSNVEMSSVFLLPILSQMTPPGNRNSAEKTRCDEMINPRKLAENPSSRMYRLKMTEKMPIPTVVKAWLNKNILEFLENDFILSM